MKEASDIEFQVRSGNREKIPDSRGNENLLLLSTLIEICWNQNPDQRPTFKMILQDLASRMVLI